METTSKQQHGTAWRWSEGRKSGRTERKKNSMGTQTISRPSPHPDRLLTFDPIDSYLRIRAPIQQRSIMQYTAPQSRRTSYMMRDGHRSFRYLLHLAIPAIVTRDTSKSKSQRTDPALSSSSLMRQSAQTWEEMQDRQRTLLQSCARK